MDALATLRGARVRRGGRPVLDGVDWSLRRGERWALWGPNGAGKSTLLALLAGALGPDEGRVERALGLRVGWVAQTPRLPADRRLGTQLQGGGPEVRAREAAVRAEERRLSAGQGDLDAYARARERFEEAGGYAAEARVRAELRRFLPDADDDVPLGALSDGERRRVALALALAARPDLLLLDEPTNGLDMEARRTLAQRLASREGTQVVASHDRELLARVGTASAHVREGRLEAARTGFDAHRRRLDQDQRADARRATEARKEEARLEQARRRAAAWGTPALRGQRRGLARRATAAAAKAEATEAHAAAQRPASVEVPAAQAEARAGPLAWGADLTRPPVLRGATLRLEAGAKIVLVGPNGSGKSTLLRLLAGEVAPEAASGRLHLREGASVWHVDSRARGLTAGVALRAQLERWVDRSRAHALLARVGLPAERALEPPDAFSGGERARAGLALMLAREADLILLDEPEADLDLPMLEALEAALVATPAAVVVATHDARLAEAVGRERWSIRDGGVHTRGGEAASAPDAPTATPSARSAPDLDALEDEAAALEALLMDPLAAGPRQRARAEARLRALTEQRMAAYEARLPAPAPRLRAVEAGLVVEADLGDARLRVYGDLPALPDVRLLGSVAHLQLPDPAGACLTPWARRALLDAGARLAFEAWNPRAVQAPAPAHLTAQPPWEAFDDDWWVLRRLAYLARGSGRAQLGPTSAAAGATGR